ncbi:MAG: hypothetical protein ACKN80_01720 [Actinomycetales bacterium]
MATKKKAAAKKRPAKRVAAKRPAKRAAKRTVKKAVKKTAKRTAKKSAKRPAKKSAKRSANTVDVSKLVIPPVPTRGSSSTSSFSSTSAPKAAPASAPKTPAKKSNSSGILFLVIAGIVLLAIFALSNTSSDDDAAPKPTPSESVTDEPSDEPSEEPTAEPSESASGSFTYEAPSKFVAINNASGGVTLRWVAPTATEGLTGYLVSISYNAVDFVEVATVPADQLKLDVAKVGDEGGTQFFIQSVYSDGTKADGAKFALKGKYE